MTRLREMTIRARTAAAVLGAAGLAVAAAGPAAAAASPGWRLFAQHHYGAAANFSGDVAVVAPGAGNAWALGGTNLAMTSAAPAAQHWNGRQWQVAALPAGLTGTIGPASAPSATDVWAGGSTGEYVLHWNGRQWAVAHRFAGSGLAMSGLTALSPANVWVFGASGFGPGLGTWHFNGKAWTPVTGPGASVSSASALSAASIWGIGRTGPSAATTIFHFNGRAWTPVKAPLPANAQLTAIRAISPANVWAVGETNGSRPQTLVLHWNGKTWQRVGVPFSVQPSAVIPDGRGGIWLAASSGSVTQVFWAVHRSATGAWTRTKIGTNQTKELISVALVPGTASVWGAGRASTTAGSNSAIFAFGPIG
jgi:hypothetical protein